MVKKSCSVFIDGSNPGTIVPCSKPCKKGKTNCGTHKSTRTLTREDADCKYCGLLDPCVQNNICTDCRINTICSVVTGDPLAKTTNLLELFHTKMRDGTINIQSKFPKDREAVIQQVKDKLRSIQKNPQRTLKTPEQLVQIIRDGFLQMNATQDGKNEVLEFLKTRVPEYIQLFNSNPGYYENLILQA